MNENYDNFKSYFTNEDEFNSWYEIVKDILNNEEFKKRVYFKHHEKQILLINMLKSIMLIIKFVPLQDFYMIFILMLGNIVKI